MESHQKNTEKFRNFEKIMAMVCTAAMISGASAPVWAADDTETAAEAAEETAEFLN